MLVSVDMFVPVENGSLFGQHPRIDGKGKIAKAAILGENSRCWMTEGAGALEQLLGSRCSRHIPGRVKARACYWTKQINYHAIDSRWVACQKVGTSNSLPGIE